MSPPVLPDPGDGNPIPVTQSARIFLTSAAPGETNTLPNPAVDGLTLILVGNSTNARTITAATAVAPGLSTLGVGAGEFIILRSTETRAGTDVPAFVWTVMSNYGVTLS